METDKTIESAVETCTWLWTGSSFEPATGIPVTDRGFRYGMSVFESFPVRNGVGHFLAEHLQRLRIACAATGITSHPEAFANCETVLKQARDGFGRIYVTAGDGTVTGACDEGRVLVMVEGREPVPARVYHRGYDLGLHSGGHVPVFGGIKTGNYWANLKAFREGVAARHNETLLFTPVGHLISACMANVFVVRHGILQTPDLSTGARPGVAREWVMRHATAQEKLLTRADVEAAEEVFLTSSWLGVMPGASLENRVLQRTMSARLLDAWRKNFEAR
jgi:branched-subunit amino acid aminotransferase/4-amino-4-deoxychorismate lyase